MNRIQFPVTGIGLLGLFAVPEAFRNLVIANSITGLWYMHSEYQALRTHGTKILGVTLRVPNRAVNEAANVLAHALLPCILLMRARGTQKRLTIAHTFGLYAIGLTLLDLEALYPTRTKRLESYVQLHLAVFALSHLLLT